MKDLFTSALVSFLVISTFSIPTSAQSSTTKTAQTESPELSRREAALWQRALAIHRSSILVDGHNDILSMMTDDNYDLGTSSVGKYHTDLARMKQGGVTAEFFSVYVDRKYATEGGSARRALDFVRARMWRGGRLLATCKDGRAHLDAYLDDYAFLILALIELLQAEFRGADLAFAEELARFLFGDREHLIQLDMSQLVSPESVSELRGPPTGVEGWERGGRLANAMKSLGIKKGDRIAVFLPRTPELYIAILGVHRLGAIPVPLAPYGY